MCAWDNETGQRFKSEWAKGPGFSDFSERREEPSPSGHPHINTHTCARVCTYRPTHTHTRPCITPIKEHTLSQSHNFNLLWRSLTESNNHHWGSNNLPFQYIEALMTQLLIDWSTPTLAPLLLCPRPLQWLKPNILFYLVLFILTLTPIQYVFRLVLYVEECLTFGVNGKVKMNHLTHLHCKKCQADSSLIFVSCFYSDVQHQDTVRAAGTERFCFIFSSSLFTNKYARQTQWQVLL